jgi:hypothetical protein
VRWTGSLQMPVGAHRSSIAAARTAPAVSRTSPRPAPAQLTVGDGVRHRPCAGGRSHPPPERRHRHGDVGHCEPPGDLVGDDVAAMPITLPRTPSSTIRWICATRRSASTASSAGRRQRRHGCRRVRPHRRERSRTPTRRSGRLPRAADICRCSRTPTAPDRRAPRADQHQPRPHRADGPPSPRRSAPGDQPITGVAHAEHSSTATRSAATLYGGTT